MQKKTVKHGITINAERVGRLKVLYSALQKKTVKHDITISAEGAERLKVLYSVLSGIPERNINIYFWGKRQVGTCLEEHVGCAGGWAALYPPFQAQGMRYTHDGCPIYKEYYAYHAMNMFFGMTDSGNIFSGGHGKFEEEISLRSVRAMSHKQMLLRRIRRALRISGYITRERSRQLAREEGTPE